MSRTKKDILDTEAMLHRLGELLAQHAIGEATMQSRADAESLRRISMTLHRWHELECGDSNDYASWCITRGYKENGKFVYDDNGVPWLERHPHNDSVTSYSRLADRERSSKKRLAKILKSYPGLTAYVQGDPRGCALYILKQSDIPEGATIDSCYSRGLAVYR